MFGQMCALKLATFESTYDVRIVAGVRRKRGSDTGVKVKNYGLIGGCSSFPGSDSDLIGDHGAWLHVTGEPLSAKTFWDEPVLSHSRDFGQLRRDGMF